MAHWTNKHWGVIIGVAIALSITLIGAGVTALAVLFGVAGYFVGKILDGELDLEEIRARVRARAQGRAEREDQSNLPGGASGAGLRTDGGTSRFRSPAGGPVTGGPAGSQPPSGRVR